MKNNLQVITHNGIEVIDSREVAHMVEKPHSDLMKSIRNYADALNAGDFSSVDFFIPSTYTDGKGETRPCYLITKKGCDMVANKMTGEKGVLFTAAYVTAFEKMRSALTAPPQFSGLSPQLQALINLEMRQNAQDARMDAIEEETASTRDVMQKTLDIFSAPAVSPDDWTEAMNHQINTLVERYEANHQKYRSDLYKELESTAGVDLTLRQTRLRNRMKNAGATVSECKSVSKLQVVARDRKLRPIFESIVRRRAALLLSASEQTM